MGARQCKEMKVAMDLVQIQLSGYFAAGACGVSKGALYRSKAYKQIKASRVEANGETMDDDDAYKVPQADESPIAVADILEKANSVTNDGRGSDLCRSVIASLRRKDVDAAIKVIAKDSSEVKLYGNLAFVYERTGLTQNV